MANRNDLIAVFHQVPDGDDKWEEALKRVYMTLYDNPHMMAHWPTRATLPFLIGLTHVQLRAMNGPITEVSE